MTARPLDWYHVTSLDALIMDGRSQRGHAAGKPGPGLTLMQTMWHEKQAAGWHMHRATELITPRDRMLGLGSWRSTVAHQTAAGAV